MTVADDPLARLRQRYHDEVAAEAAKKAQAAKQEAAQKVDQRQRALTEVAGRVREVLGAALDGWEIRPPADETDDKRVVLVPTFAPQVGLYAQWVTEKVRLGETDGRPHVLLGDYQREPAKCWNVYPGCTRERAEGILARLIVPKIEAHEANQAHDARIRAREAQEQAKHEEEARRTGRADIRLQELIAEAETWADGQVAQVEATFGWPEGRELTVYKLEWYMGHDEDGSGIRHQAYADSREPDEDGLFRVLMGNGTVRQGIAADAYIYTELVWRRTDDLPVELRSQVYIRRSLTVATTWVDAWGAGTGEHWPSGPYQEVSRQAYVPCPAVRLELGQPSLELKPIRDDVVEWLDGVELPKPTSEAVP